MNARKIVIFTTTVLLLLTYAFAQDHMFTQNNYSIFSNVIVPDFRVNTDTTGRCFHNDPEIACSNNGRSVVAWSDVRNGKSDIYFQLFNKNGIAISGNIQVNEVYVEHPLNNISVDMQDNGNFIIAWTDFRKKTIFFQRFNLNGNPIGNNTIANDDDGNDYKSDLTIAIDSTGRFCIAWEDDRDGDNNIYFQRYDNQGNALGLNTRLNDNNTYSSKHKPDMGMADNGYFIITWVDGRSWPSSIYAQRFNMNGDSLESNIKVNNLSDTSPMDPAITVHSNGAFIIAWRYDDDIYCQQFKASGNAYGNNIQITNSEDGQWQREPSLDLNTDGNYVISWMGRDNNDDDDIYLQSYDVMGNALCDIQMVNNDAGENTQSAPSVSIDEFGDIMVVWQDTRHALHNYDIYAQRYDVNGNLSGSNFIINDDKGSRYQGFPSIDSNENDKYVITWEDSRDYDYDIYCQMFNSNGTTIGENILVMENDSDIDQHHPDIAILPNGEFIITWYENRIGNNDIFLRRFQSDGNPEGNGILVNNDDEDDFGHYCPVIGVDEQGNSIVVWYDDRNSISYSYDIFFQRFDSNGDTLGSNVKVNESSEELCRDPSISVTDEGDFIITWNEDRQNIYSQCYDKNGNKIGNNTIANENISSYSRRYSSVSVRDDGSYVVAWEDDRNGDFDIYYQEFDALGDTIGMNILVTDDQDSSDQSYPTIALNTNGDYTIIWEDQRNDTYDIYGQYYKANEEALGGNFPINNTVFEPNGETRFPRAIISDSKIISIWRENRIAGRGYDIFSNTIDLSSVAIQSINDFDYSLHQNYPNPFNGATRIKYALTEQSDLNLIIYDITGRKIKEWRIGHQSAGWHELIWNGTNNAGKSVSTGIYIYSLQADGFIDTKKMVFMK